MKIKIFIIFTLTLFNASLYAATAKECRQNNRQEFLEINHSLYEKYNSIDPKQVVTDEKKAFWIEGNPLVNKAIFLAHGFMGSPSEMKFIADPFIKSGWTVVGFLIPGHGSTFQIANKFKYSRWINDFKKQLELVTECYSEVRAIGFSTGGLLIHHYALTRPIPNSLKSLHYISPFFLQRINGVFEEILGTFVNGISVDKAYFLTHFNDLKVMTIDRNFYHQNIPINSAFEVKKMGEKVYRMAGSTMHMQKIPVQLFLSKGDWTVDTEATKEVMNRDYQNINLIWFNGIDPHHLMMPSVRKKNKKVQNLIFNFQTL
jgi:carboxylesterase